MSETFTTFVNGTPSIASPTGSELVPIISGGITNHCTTNAIASIAGDAKYANGTALSDGSSNLQDSAGYKVVDNAGIQYSRTGNKTVDASGVHYADNGNKVVDASGVIYYAYTGTAGNPLVNGSGLINYSDGSPLTTNTQGLVAKATISSSAATSLTLTSQTSGPGVSVGTLTNAPSAGNPNFWLAISINGVTRRIPCW